MFSYPWWPKALLEAISITIMCSYYKVAFDSKGPASEFFYLNLYNHIVHNSILTIQKLGKHWLHVMNVVSLHTISGPPPNHLWDIIHLLVRTENAKNVSVSQEISALTLNDSFVLNYVFFKSLLMSKNKLRFFFPLEYFGELISAHCK